MFEASGRQINDPDAGLQQSLYNAFDELVRTTKADGSTISYAYDELGRAKTITDKEGTKTFTWDTGPGAAVGLLAQASSPAQEAQFPQAVTVSRSYDALSRPVTENWSVGGAAYLLERTYEANTGRVETVKYPAVGAKRFSVKYAYTADGLLNTISDVSGTTPAPIFAAGLRDPSGRLLARHDGNGAQMPRFMIFFGQVRLLSTMRGGTDLQRRVYEYSTNGNVTNRHDFVGKTSEKFEYDALDRLQAWRIQQACSSPSVTFTYDDAGHLLKRAPAGGSEPTLVFTYGGTGKPVHGVSIQTRGTQNSTYLYDQNGNRTSCGYRIRSVLHGARPAKRDLDGRRHRFVPVRALRGAGEEE